MVTRVDPFLGGLGIDATNKFEVASNATVTIGNGTSTGNVHIGGNIGIGTSGPLKKLDVSSAVAEIAINSTGSSYSRVNHYHNGTVLWTTGTRTATDYHIYRESGGGNVIIDQGNVGIGTTTIDTALGTKLHVAGTIRTDTGAAAANPAIVFDHDNFADADANYIMLDRTSEAMRFNVNASERMRITSVGNVGIGNTAPSYLLDLYRAASTVARIRNSAATGGTPSATHGEFVIESTDANMGMQFLGSTTANQRILFGDTDSGGSGQVIYDHTSNYMALSTATAERMRITSAGDVGIGIASPDGKLNVQRTAASAGWIINGQTVGVANDSGLYMDASNNIELAVRNGSGTLTGAVRSSGITFFNGGNVGIGKTDPSTALDVSGNIAVSGTVDGRDVATDGTKLDGIESGATADQTASEILTAIKTVDGAGSGLDADTVDGIQAASFLRSDAADTATGILTLNDDLVFANRTTTDGHIQLYGSTGVGGYALGVEGSTLYYRAGFIHRWYIGTYADAGSSDYMELTTTGLTINGNIVVTGTVDGRDVATDGTKLDGIESGATADQTASEILTAIKTVDGSGSGLDADTVDGYNPQVGSTTGPANTIVLRNANGDDYRRYGFSTFFNMSHGQTTRTADTIFYSSTDGYIRKNNSSGFRQSLGLGTDINANVIPPGSIIMYGAAAAPAGWYLCEGGAISRSTYSGLFGVIGTTYGAGDGSTTFNVPDFRDRAPYGASTFTLGSKTAGEVNASGQNSTGTGTSGSSGATTVANTTGAGGGHTPGVTTSTTNSTTDKDVTNAITVVTGVNAVANHTHSIPSLTVNGHTHSVPALTVTHPGVAVKFIIKT